MPTGDIGERARAHDGTATLRHLAKEKALVRRGQSAENLEQHCTHHSLRQRNFMVHQLERCLYLSTRKVTRDEHPCECFQSNNENGVVDGALGLHVDMGGGEGVSSERERER